MADPNKDLMHDTHCHTLQASGRQVKHLTQYKTKPELSHVFIVSKTVKRVTAQRASLCATCSSCVRKPRPTESAKTAAAFLSRRCRTLLAALAWCFQRSSASFPAFVSYSKWSLREEACLATAVCRPGPAVFRRSFGFFLSVHNLRLYRGLFWR